MEVILREKFSFKKVQPQSLTLNINLQELLLVFLATCFIMYPAVNAVCNVCQENNVACMNLTSFYLCFEGNSPDTEHLFTCPDGLVCTNLPNICFQRSTLPASCGDTASCNKCNSNQVFACTSRTTFAFCFGSTLPSKVSGSCPPGKVCDAASVNFCVNELKTTSIVCDLEQPLANSYFRKTAYLSHNINN